MDLTYPIAMQSILGENVKNANRPGPIGFGLGSGHSPTAARTMIVRSGPQLNTNNPIPILTGRDFSYLRIASSVGDLD